MSTIVFLMIIVALSTISVNLPANPLVHGILLGVSILTSAMLIWLYIDCYYMLGETHLTIHFGFIHERIELSTIESVEPVKRLRISTALSRYRLKLQASGHPPYDIAPLDQSLFLTELAKRIGAEKIKHHR